MALLENIADPKHIVLKATNIRQRIRICIEVLDGAKFADVMC